MTAFSPGGIGQQSVTAGLKTNPTIYNLEMDLANTEYSQALPSDTKSFMVKFREPTKALLRYQSGSSEYLTIPTGTIYKEERISGSTAVTIYLETTKPSMVAEIVVWT